MGEGGIAWVILIDWEGFGGVWKVLEGWIHRDLLVWRNSVVFHYDLRGDSPGALSMWQRGLLVLIDFEGWIHRDCLILGSSDVFHYDLRGDSPGMELCGIAGCLI